MPVTKGTQIKKRHHFVPKAYLRSFVDDRGRVLVYRKDQPSKVLEVDPDTTGFERYYYSQPTPEGGVDHNTLEDLFSNLEGLWPPLVQAMQKSEDVNDSLPVIFQFMILQRVRVPASRDATEARLAAEVHRRMLDMLNAGLLPPPPPSLEGRLAEVVVSIDPHKSIHGMVDDINATASIFDRIGLTALHNHTNIPFLTSDNPVIWFDPSVTPLDQQPYRLRPGGPLQLVFPISPTLCLIGSPQLKRQFATHGLLYGNVGEVGEWVNLVNRHVCRYAYKAVYASKRGQESLIESLADESPVWQTEGHEGRLVFGKRTAKPKW
jgi:hypothetical protein